MLTDIFDITVAVIVCAKQEELYIDEWIQWYQKLGVDKIFIADNNLKNYPNLKTYLQKYNDVEVFDYKEYPSVQMSAYKDIFMRERNNYDWFIFCDVDEFLHIPAANNNIKEWLQWEQYQSVDAICIYWRMYDDNDLFTYDPRPVQERFTRLSNTHYCKNGEYFQVKSIIRGKTNLNYVFTDPHYILDYDQDITTCNVLGEFVFKYDHPEELSEHYKIAYFAHFFGKTIEEFLNNKYAKGDSLITRINPNKKEEFFRYNIRDEKRFKLMYPDKKYEPIIYPEDTITDIAYEWIS